MDSEITRDQFMEFFRDEDKLNELSGDDRIEVFSTILSGSSDFTVDLLQSVLADYNVEGIEITKVDPGLDSKTMLLTRFIDARFGFAWTQKVLLEHHKKLALLQSTMPPDLVVHALLKGGMTESEIIRAIESTKPTTDTNHG